MLAEACVLRLTPCCIVIASWHPDFAQEASKIGLISAVYVGDNPAQSTGSSELLSQAVTARKMNTDKRQTALEADIKG
jgi:hypothetical protein